MFEFPTYITVAGVDEEFMPWLVAEVSQEIESIITSRDVITGEPLSQLPNVT